MPETDELKWILDEAIASYDTMVEEVKAERPPKGPFACAQGCNTCCYQPELSLSAVEVFCIAAFIAENYTPEQAEHLDQRLSDIWKAKTETVAVRPQPLYECPLLTTEGCSVYDVRPIACRGHHSYDLAECEEAKSTGFNVPVIHQYGEQVSAAQMVVVAVRQSIVENGLEADLLDLHLALKVVRDDPSARERWMDGESIFTGVHAINAEP